MSEQIAAEIQRYVQQEGLRPGDRLGTEEELARQLGVSRPTLREALRVLSSGNLVRSTRGPGGGIFVANTPSEGMGRSVSDSIAMMLELRSISIEELLDARILLEVPLTGRAAARATGDTLDELRSAVSDGEKALEADDDETLREADARLHRAIAAAADNPVVYAFIEWAFDVLQPLLKDLIAPVVDEAEITKQHRAIYRAIEKGDLLRAERAMRDHLNYLQDLVRQLRERSSDHGFALARAPGVEQPGR